MLADLIFTTPTMESLFSDETELGFMLAFESALAQAQATLGIIPKEVAYEIVVVCQQKDWELAWIREQVLLSGNPAIPFVNLLKKKVNQHHPAAAQYVHQGATSQDVIDTALMCQLKQAFLQCQQDLAQLNSALLALAEVHAHTPMMGRTLLQQALPITFGEKVKNWQDGLGRLTQQLPAVMTENLVLQLGGPVGNGESLGAHKVAVQQQVANALNLTPTLQAWHTQRDRLVSLATWLGTLTGLLGKIATDVILLMQTEVNELKEGAAEGKGGSSSMPHKRNPVTATFMVAIAHRTPHLVSSLLAAMMHPHERAAGAWHSEWAVIRELTKLTTAQLSHANELISQLEVDTKQMLDNITSTSQL